MRPADPDPRTLHAVRARLQRAALAHRPTRRWPWAVGATLAAATLVAVFAFGLQALSGRGPGSSPLTTVPATGCEPIDQPTPADRAAGLEPTSLACVDPDLATQAAFLSTPVTVPVYPPERISTHPIERRWTNAAGLRQFVRETQQGTPGGWAVVAVTQEGDPVTTTVVLTEPGAPWSVFVDRSADAFSGSRGVELYACTGLDLQARDLVLSGCTGAGLTEPTTLGFASNLPLDPNYDLDEIEAQLRTWLGRPALELTLQGAEPFMNSAQPATVWILTDAEGRIYKIEQETGTLVEIDARAQFELAPSGPALELHELRAMATRLLAAATPAADITESRWIDQSGSKDNNFFFDWRDAQGRRVQVAYTASGFLFGYLNTLAMPVP
jgi:hypothetical protein